MSAETSPKPQSKLETIFEKFPFLTGLVALLMLMFQFGLLIVVLQEYKLVSKKFVEISAYLAFTGFLVHHYLPSKTRLAFFSLLSVASVFLATIDPDSVRSWLQPTLIILIGASLIGVAHLPISFRNRIIIMLAYTGVLLGLRYVAIHGDAASKLKLESTFEPYFWPLLGSLFMFRMIVYLYDLRHNAAPFSPARAFAYFFMLPNICFPLFPVIDYKSFCRSHYNDVPFRIYQKGVIYMFRGVIHLILYRLVYQHLLLDPTDQIIDARTAGQYLLGTYLLYLKVSGWFHLIVGMLHLFGFNLSETHHLFLLASSFTDFWRRINIYWKDFIQKIFFNPAYFQLNRKVGAKTAMGLATAYAFFCTWMLHSYQTFWIIGDFPILFQDAAFWTFLGVALYLNMLWEGRKSAKSRSLTKKKATLGSELRRSGATVATFVVICTTWTMWNSFEELPVVLENLVKLDLASVLWISGVLILVAASSVYFRMSKREISDVRVRKLDAEEGNPLVLMDWPSLLKVVVICCLLIGVGRWPEVVQYPAVAQAVVDLQNDQRLNRRDHKALERGYYEDLMDVGRHNPELASIFAERPVDWGEATHVRDQPVDVFPGYELIPDGEFQFKGATVRSNRWGLRDKDYEKTKASGVLRIALLGASHTFGSGVGNEEAYEAIVEERLNQEFGGKRYEKIEILNFSLGGFGPITRMHLLKTQVAQFEPDIVMLVMIDDFTWVVNELVHQVSEGRPIPYDFITQELDQVGLEAGDTGVIAKQKIQQLSGSLTERLYREVVETAHANGMEPVAVFIPRPERGLLSKEALAHGQRVAAEAGFRVLDITDAYDGIADLESLWLARWDRHPNAQGHELLAKRFYPELVALLFSEPSSGVAD